MRPPQVYRDWTKYKIWRKQLQVFWYLYILHKLCFHALIFLFSLYIFHMVLSKNLTKKPYSVLFDWIDRDHFVESVPTWQNITSGPDPFRRCMHREVGSFVLFTIGKFGNVGLSGLVDILRCRSFIFFLYFQLKPYVRSNATFYCL